MNLIKKTFYTLVILHFLSFGTSLFGQTDKEFWFVAPEVNDRHGNSPNQGQPTFLRLATYDLPATVTISQPANPLFNPIIVNIPANSNKSLEFRRNGSGANVYDLNKIENKLQGPTLLLPGNVNDVGIKISSTANITAYYEISASKNKEIIVLKGKNAVGRNFYVPFQTKFSVPGKRDYPNLYSAIDIVVTQSTTVNIKPTFDMLIIEKSGQNKVAAGTTYSINLKKGQTFSAVPYKKNFSENTTHKISRYERLEGTRVWSNDSCIAVQTKDDLVWDGGGDVDYVADQLVPTSLLGLSYVVMTGKISTVNEYVYVLSTENNTTIALNGITQFSNVGEGVQNAIRIDNLPSKYNLIKADKPILVFHVSGFAGQMGGSILPQIDVCTGSQEVVFTRPSNTPFFMNILVRKGAENEFKLLDDNGNEITLPAITWEETVPNTWMATTIDASSITTENTTYSLSNRDVFHLAIINGSGETDCFYGYFSDFNELKAFATIEGTIDDGIVICYGESVQLISNKANSYNWTANKTPYYIDDPTSQNPIVSPLTTTKYTVAITGGCNLTASTTVEVFVSEPIEARITLSDVVGCAPLEVSIENHSEDNWPVKNYKLSIGNTTDLYTTDFGTIHHTFENNTTAPITYPIKLITKNALRCKDSLYADVTVYPAIHADFEPQTNTSGCNPLRIPFKNLSSGHTGSYRWTFGDGGTSIQPSPIHTYNNHSNDTKTYIAELIATAPSFLCKDTISRTITVEPAMYAQFYVDKNSGCAPLTIKPINLSSPTSIDEYKWEWGDGTSTDTKDPGSHIYENTSGVIKTYTIKLTVKKGNCTDAIEETITVYPGVTTTIQQDVNIGCHPLTVNFNEISTGNVANRKWLFGDGTVANDITSEIHEFKNFDSNDKVFTTQLIVSTSNECADTAEVTTTVHPAISANFSPNYIKGCANLKVSVVNKSTGAINKYKWDWGDGSPLESTTDPSEHTYTNPSDLTVERNLKLTVSNAANCSDEIIQPIQIYPVADATFTASPLIGCNPLTVDFKHTPVNSVPVQLDWNFGDNSFGSLTSFEHIYEHQKNTNQQYQVELNALTTNGCSDTKKVTVEVKPYINSAFDIDTAKGCSPLNVNIQNNSTGKIDTYTWKKGNTTFSTDAAPGSISFINDTDNPINTTITLIASNSNGSCVDSLTKKITIYPSVDATFTAVPQNGCNPLTVDFTHTPINNPDISWNWTFGDNNTASIANPQHTFINESSLAKTFKTELAVKSIYNCTASAKQDIQVASIIQPEFTMNKANGCSPLTIELKDITIGEVTSRTWKKSGVIFASSTAPTITLFNHSNTPIDTIISLTVGNSGPGSCQATVSKKVTIYPSVDATFTQDQISGCNPLKIKFNHTPENTADINWNWTFGDNNTANIANPEHTYTNETSATKTFKTKLVVQSAYSCKDSAEQDIEVASIIHPDFTLSTANGCSPLTIELKDESSGDIVSRIWDKSGNIFAIDEKMPIIKLFNNTDNPIDTIITLTVKNSGPGTCKASISKTVTIYPSIDATFTAIPLEGCNPLTVNFNYTPSNHPDVNLLWDFKDKQTSNKQNPIHTFINNDTKPNIYGVELKAQSPFGCKDSTHIPITVAPFLNAKLSANKVKGCSPLQISFTDISEGKITSRTWQRNGITFSNAANPKLQLKNTSKEITYDTITLIVTNGGPGSCADTAKQIITIYPEVDATFTHAVKNGCNPLLVNFKHTSGQDIPIDYYWNFGDQARSNLSAPEHLYENPLEADQTFEVKLLVKSKNGCRDSSYSQVKVASRLKANFTMPVSAGCSPFTANFTDASEGDISNRNWYVDGKSFATGDQASTSIVNNGNANITQKIKLVVTSSNLKKCKDSIIQEITAYPKPVANFSIDDNRGCNPHGVNFTYLPGSSTLDVYFDWQFGDNNSSDQRNPSHVFEHFNYDNISTFDVKLTTKTQYDCQVSTTQTITVERALEAMFTLDPSSSCNPFNASLKNASKGAETYQWIYGDDNPNFNTTTHQDINHTYYNNSYENQATYKTRLIVTNTHGKCTDSISRSIKVHPLLKANFEASILEGCHPVDVDFTNHSKGDSLRYYWDFDDLTSNSKKNPTHQFANTSNTTDKYFNVTLKVKNKFECEHDTTVTIRANHLPKSQFEIDKTESCAPLNIVATNTSIGYDDFEWKLGNGQTSHSTPLNYTYNNAGNQTKSFILELYTETNRNCTDKTSLTLNTYPQVEANFNITSPQGCNPHTTAFENLSVNATNFYWDFGDGRTTNQISPTTRFAINSYENKTIPVKLIASSNQNCIDSINKEVTVYVQPTTDFEATPFTQQYPQSTVNVLDLSNDGPFDFIWNFGDGYQSSEQTPEAHTYKTWGTYTINLTLTNKNFNCTDQSSQQVIITPPIVSAEFTASDTVGCMPLEINFEAKASQFLEDNYSYFWDFGDGTTSTNQTPSHTYDTAALYMVTLTVIGENGTMETSQKIRVNPLPKIAFTVEPRLVMIPDDRIQCYNLTHLAQSYLWDFGDATSSTEKNPPHYYEKEGIYNITLTATSQYGCLTSLTKERHIEVRGKGQLKFPNAFTPSTAGSSDGIYDPKSQDNNIFHPLAEGVTKYKLLIYNRWGELMFESNKIEKGWDGYYNGKICPQDVYIWKVEGKFINGKTFEQTGDVTLLQ